MTLTTALTKRLNCRHPIISAGMGGPAVSEGGGFGLLGMVRETPDLSGREIAAVRQRTSKPFGVNLIPFATDPKLLGWAQFDYDPASDTFKPNTTLQGNDAKCGFECHTIAEAKDFVFTEYGKR